MGTIEKENIVNWKNTVGFKGDAFMGHEHVYVFVSAWVCIYRYALRLGVRCGVFCKLSTLLLKT